MKKRVANKNRVWASTFSRFESNRENVGIIKNRIKGKDFNC